MPGYPKIFISLVLFPWYQVGEIVERKRWLAGRGRVFRSHDPNVLDGGIYHWTGQAESARSGLGSITNRQISLFFRTGTQLPSRQMETSRSVILKASVPW